jgi:hypothetical protein
MGQRCQMVNHAACVGESVWWFDKNEKGMMGDYSSVFLHLQFCSFDFHLKGPRLIWTNLDPKVSWIALCLIVCHETSVCVEIPAYSEWLTVLIVGD